MPSRRAAGAHHGPQHDHGGHVHGHDPRAHELHKDDPHGHAHELHKDEPLGHGPRLPFIEARGGAPPPAEPSKPEIRRSESTIQFELRKNHEEEVRNHSEYAIHTQLEGEASETGDGMTRTKSKHSFLDRLSAHAEQRHFNPLHNPNRFTAKIVAHRYWEPFCLSAIAVNAAWIGYSVDIEDPDGAAPAFTTVATDYLFGCWFNIEILLRIGAYKSAGSFFWNDQTNRLWNLFDFSLVGFMMVELFLIPLAKKGSGEKTSLPGLSALRALRLLRMTRVLRFIPELAMLVYSLKSAVRGVSMTAVLGVAIMYIFAIAFTLWAKDHEQKHFPCDPPAHCVEEAFGTILRSFLTLFQVMCFDGAFSLIRAILKEHRAYGALILVFMVVMPFTVLNMLIGVVCQIVRVASANERSNDMKRDVTNLLKLLEVEDTGYISRRELERNRHVLAELDKVGVTELTITTVLRYIDQKYGEFSLEDGFQKVLMIDLEDMTAMIFKLLQSPESQDILLIDTKLIKLYAALSATDTSQGAAVTASIQRQHELMSDDDDQGLDLSWASRESVLQTLGQFEEQVSSMLDNAVTNAWYGSGPSTTPWPNEFRRLDSAMCRLRVRLERCLGSQNSAFSSGRAGGFDMDELASSEQKYWLKLCEEVVSCMSSVSNLLAQTIQDAEPDGVRAGPDDIGLVGENIRGI